MFELKHLEKFAANDDLKELILEELDDEYFLKFNTSTTKNLTLMTQRGEKRKFKTLDAAASIAKNLANIANYESGKDLKISLVFGF